MFFRCLPVFGRFLVHRIYLSDFYVKHKFPSFRRKFGDQSTLRAVDFRLGERIIGINQRRRLRRPLVVIRYARSLDSRIASNISFGVMPFRRPGTTKGERRRGDSGVLENISPLRRRMITSSLFDSSRDRKINCFYRKIIGRFPPLFTHSKDILRTSSLSFSLQDVQDTQLTTNAKQKPQIA